MKKHFSLKLKYLYSTWPISLVGYLISGVPQDSHDYVLGTKNVKTISMQNKMYSLVKN